MFAERTEERRFLLSGATILAVAMGVGRFAYTPMLPVMLNAAGLSQTFAGTLASVHLGGYLLGALLATSAYAKRSPFSVVHACVGIVVVATSVTALPDATAWLCARFATGVGSGLILVLASSIVIDRWAHVGNSVRPSIFFSGVGVGIFATGLLVPPFVHLGGWRWGWLGLALVSAVAYGLTARWFTGNTPVARSAPTQRQHKPAGALSWLLLGAYGIEGLGYIIPATFIIAMIAATPIIARYSGFSWMLVGLVAAPTPYLWSRLARRLGKGWAMVSALVVQALGIGLPAVSANVVTVMVSAVALGGTFMGITALGTALARELSAGNSNVAIGRMTVAFGIGQIVGPLVATAFVVRAGSYAPALLFASGCLLTGAAFLASGLAYRAWRT